MTEQREEQKYKRKSYNQSIRWTDSMILDHITKIVESQESFEKSTAYKFYNKLSNGFPQLDGIPGMSMRDKMKNHRISYIEANKWKHKMGDLKENTFIYYRDKKCPHYDKPRKTKNFDQQSSISTPLPVFSIKAESESNRNLSASSEDTNQTLDESANFVNFGNNAQGYRDSSLILHQQFLQLERDKFEWQKKKEQQRLDNKFKIQQMQLEQKERLMKLELELKYKINNKNN